MDKKAESFEVTEYGDADRLDKAQSVISEIVADQVQKVPSANVRVAFTGNMVKLSYYCYEMFLQNHNKIRDVQQTSDAMLKEMVKVLKKEFKGRTGDALKLKELKELDNYSVQKVSLNERYMYVGWKFYELS